MWMLGSALSAVIISTVIILNSNFGCDVNEGHFKSTRRLQQRFGGLRINIPHERIEERTLKHMGTKNTAAQEYRTLTDPAVPIRTCRSGPAGCGSLIIIFDRT